MAGPRSLTQGRDAYSRHQWRQAFERLSAADRESALAPDDLLQLGTAAYLAAEDGEATRAWTRAHAGFVEQGDVRGAVRVGFWIGLTLLLAGRGAQSSGWLARSQRLLGEQPPRCAEQGLLRLLGGLFALFKGDAAGAAEAFRDAASLGVECGDGDLLAASVLGRGQALVVMQRIDEGVALLDEAMVAVTTGDVTPIMAGVVYCAVILTCERVYDLERAHEWTVALDNWCRSQDELVAFRGQCRVHRSALMQFKGDWDAARDEATRACTLLSGRSETLAGRALYQQAELHRLAGEFPQAEGAYRAAGDRGFEPQPGASLLRLAQGDVQGAAASIRRVGGQGPGPPGAGAGAQRLGILAPLVEIMLAADDVESARAAAEELAGLAAQRGVPYLNALAAQAVGAVRLASGDPTGALVSLRDAWTLWQQLEAPFESARARVLIARACNEVGDAEGAKSHLDAAVATFERLGAQVELSRLRTGSAGANPAVASLSSRERQVLGRVAAGKTNRQIASELGISEHTVARHVSNVFDKIDVGSRTAAAAFAFEHGLV
jgi:DNA-binding CsgD family transcriptional regulator